MKPWRRSAAMERSADVWWRGRGALKAALDRVFCSWSGLGLRFGSRAAGQAHPVFLVAGAAAADVDAAVEALRHGGVEVTPLPVTP